MIRGNCEGWGWSQRGWRLGGIRVGDLVVVDGFLGVAQARQGFPGRVGQGVALPLDQVLDRVASAVFGDLLVQNGLDLELLMILNQDWGLGDVLRLHQVRVPDRKLPQEGNVEYRMDLHGVGQLQFGRDRRNHLKNLEGANVLAAQLP